jgi:hypothetical protein
MGYHRPLNWYRASLPEDPTPGDTWIIEQEAATYRTIHSQITQTVSDLRSLDYGEMVGEVVDAFADRTREVAGLLEEVKGRYDAAARTLDTFADTLREQQSANSRLLGEILTLLDSKIVAQTNAELADSNRDQAVRYSTDQDEIDRARRRAREAWNTVDNLSGEIDAKRTAILETAVTVDNAQRDAAAQLNGAMEADGLTMGFWEKVWAGTVDIAQWISDHLSDLATALSFAALLLSWVPILGEIIVALDLIVNGLVLLADIVLAIDGRKGWGDAIFGLIGIATLGAGRVTSRAVQNYRAAARNMPPYLQTRKRPPFSQMRYRKTELQAGGRGALGQSAASQLRDALPALRGTWTEEIRQGWQAVNELAGAARRADWGNVIRHPLRSASNPAGQVGHAFLDGMLNLPPTANLPTYLDLDVVIRCHVIGGADNLINVGGDVALLMAELAQEAQSKP